MEIKDSLENALSEIDALRAKMSELSKRKDIHQIELDLLLQKLRDLYDFLLSLKFTEEPSQLITSQEKSIKNSQKEDKPNPVKSNLRNSIEIENLNSAKTDTPILSTENIEKEESHHDTLKGKLDVKQEPIHEKPSETKKSVHELLSESSTAKPSLIGKVLHSKPLQNIEDAIGVNDKFLFIRELFNSNAGRYKETIDALNNAADFNSAYSYIEQNFEWDPENEATQKLLELIRRRHISHKNG